VFTAENSIIKNSFQNIKKALCTVSRNKTPSFVRNDSRIFLICQQGKEKNLKNKVFWAKDERKIRKGWGKVFEIS
jgi:hypothetical protein